MTIRSVILRRAHPNDLRFIMSTEQTPGFERMVSRWSEQAHLVALAAASHAYLLGTQQDGAPVAFAILGGLDDPHGNVCLKRIVVTSPGNGWGSSFLRLVVDWTFRETSAHRLWLDVVADNARARHVYLTQHFVVEGTMREAFRMPDGSRSDLILVSMTRSEWMG